MDTEGLAEYDAYYYTTQWNRTVAVDRLLGYVDRYDRNKIYCCRTLATRTISTPPGGVLDAGAVLMMFLAEHFGENIHIQLLRSPLDDVLARRATTVGVRLFS